MNGTELPGFTSALLGALGATVVVALIAWAALSVLRRVIGRAGVRGAGQERRGGRLRVVQTVPLGTRERAVLVVDDEHEYLLGVATGGVSLLASHPRETGKVPAVASTDDAGTPEGRSASPSPSEKGDRS